MLVLFDDILLFTSYSVSKDLIKVYTLLYQQGIGQEKILLRSAKVCPIFYYLPEAIEFIKQVKDDTVLPEGMTVNEIIDSEDIQTLEKCAGFSKVLFENEDNYKWNLTWNPVLFDISCLNLEYYTNANLDFTVFDEL